MEKRSQFGPDFPDEPRKVAPKKVPPRQQTGEPRLRDLLRDAPRAFGEGLLGREVDPHQYALNLRRRQRGLPRSRSRWPRKNWLRRSGMMSR